MMTTGERIYRRHGTGYKIREDDDEKQGYDDSFAFSGMMNSCFPSTHFGGG
jgi:hypothetical protein